MLVKRNPAYQKRFDLEHACNVAAESTMNPQLKIALQEAARRLKGQIFCPSTGRESRPQDV
jgi:hypothetical protein